MHPLELSAGISLLLQKKSNHFSPPPDESFTALFEKVDYQSESIRFLISKPYPDYPVTIFSVGKYSVALEGKIYNCSQERIVKTIQEIQAFSGAGLQQLTAGWSGEWCLWIQNENQLMVINDPLSRLSIYHYTSEDFFFIGRSFQPMAKAGLLQPCRQAAASLLWSSYFIGHRTPYKNVYRLAGASVAEIDLYTSTAQITYGRSLNFDERHTLPLKQTATSLADLFEQACRNISQNWPGKIIVSLSGGQDSRAVAAALKAARPASNDGAQLLAASFTMEGSKKDAAIANDIARLLAIPFETFSINETAGYEQQLLLCKGGMNYTGMSFILSFYRQLLQKQGNGFLYVTGDGGDKALPYLGEQKPPVSLDELVVQLSRRHAMAPVETAATLTGLAAADILQMIYEVVKTYPETSMNNRSIHFAIYERAMQSMFEGEDRSRCFFWATSPFYDLDFFKAAMQVPDAYKKHYRLYRPFQNALNQQVADLPDAGGYNINQWQFVLRKGVQEAFRSAPPSVKNLVRRLGGKSIAVNQYSDAEREQLLTILQNAPALQQTLQPNAVAAFLQTANQEQYLNLKTLILLKQFYTS